MWKSQCSSESSPDLFDAVTELMQGTSRNIIYATGVAGLGLQILMGIGASDQVGMGIWLMMMPLALTAAIVLRLIPRQLLAAQAVWQVGLALIIASALVLFKQPEIAFLYVVLPFMAVVAVGWPAALLSEGLVVGLSYWFSYGPAMAFLPPGYFWGIILGGAFTGIIGWAGSQSLYTVTQWSLQSFDRARENMTAAQHHRAQLAQVLKDLDQAYYRLERTNAALVVAWRAAAEAERFKTEFATNLSHELRTPLNLIIGFCEMMITAPQKYEGIQIPRPYRSDLNAIYHNAKHLLAMVNDVLDLARIDVGRLVLTREESDVPSLVAEATGMVREYVEAKGLELRIQLAENLPTLHIDRLRIRQVLLNLLVNAARFTERGWISVEATCQDDSVLLRVSDTGRGIPGQELPKVFEEFSQTSISPSQGWSGTGLGLPISKKFVQLHGGGMGVESTYLQGTTFWFTLPCAPGLSAGPQAPPLVSPRPLERPGIHKRVLVVVHDDQRVIGLLQRYLDDYHLVGATSLKEGVTLANDIKAVALIAQGQAIPLTLADDVLYLSCPLPDPRRAAGLLGAQDLLVKPISDQELWEAIDGVDGMVQRVLIADDDPDMVRLIRRMLNPRIARRNCLEAHNGEETLRLLRMERPDLLLLDLIMPIVDGREVLAQMAEEPELADIPVIIISAKDQEEIGFRLSGPVQAAKPGGLHLGDVVRALEANLDALAPDWQ